MLITRDWPCGARRVSSPRPRIEHRCWCDVLSNAATVSAPCVALVTLTDMTVPGGASRSVHMLGAGLRRQGHDVATVSRPYAANVGNSLVRRVWRRIDYSSEEVRRIRGALGGLAADLRDVPRDTVCIAFEAWSAATCVESGLTTICRVAGLGSITDEWIRNGFVDGASRHVPWLRTTERHGFQGAARVVALSSAGREAVAGLGAAAESVVVIPNGIAAGVCPGPRAVSDCDDAEVRLLCVANLRPVKGVDVLATALAGLDDDVRRRVRLVHLGDGNAPGNSTFERARDTLTRADVAHEFCGAVPPERVDAELRAADLFVLPSRVEMFSNALLEAMAAALPIVATDAGASAAVLGERARMDGLVVPPGDAVALAAALARAIRDPALRRAHGLANRARVETEFSVERTIDSYAALVREVAR